MFIHGRPAKEVSLLKRIRPLTKHADRVRTHMAVLVPLSAMKEEYKPLNMLMNGRWCLFTLHMDPVHRVHPQEKVAKQENMNPPFHKSTDSNFGRIGKWIRACWGENRSITNGNYASRWLSYESTALSWEGSEKVLSDRTLSIRSMASKTRRCKCLPYIILTQEFG